MARSLGVALLCVLGLAVPAQAARGPAPVSRAPQGLKGFLLKASAPTTHVFSRTPSFAWSPVPGATRYEFELAASKRFSENSVIYTDSKLKGPTAAVPMALPWSSGSSYSLYAHVRAITRKGATPWSTPFGFSMRWNTVPAPLTPSYPGLVRWSTVPGATSYKVWFVDAGKIFTSLSNVADEREFYTFHQDSLWTSAVRWRVRAVRNVYGAAENGLPAVSYGPWSPIYTHYNPPFGLGALTDLGTVSDTLSNALAPAAHRLMPGFLYTGNQGIGGTSEELYHVYVFTDQDCLNMVFKGSVVGSPAYAPRASGPLGLPLDSSAITAARTAYLGDGDQGTVYTYEGIRIVSTESSTTTVAGSAPVDLWDTDWPTGRYYWSVVPVKAIVSQGFNTTLGMAALAGTPSITVGNATAFAPGDQVQIGNPSNSELGIVQSVSGNTITLAGGLQKFHAAGEPVSRPAGTIEYRDTELTQDSCSSGRVLTFGKSSEPVTTGGAGTPYASGLSPRGHLVSATRPRPTFYGPVTVAWQPALSASQYEIEWSRKAYPWSKVASQLTYGTSATLPLSVGKWYYRVRGLNFSVPNKPQMSWSDPVALVLAKPTFRVVR
ncbi:MAG: hypothetical protein M3R70_06920 [Actinomycetota bacterium]|nr:hypothetical protein [Actinomycetota bacterium]